MLAPCPVDVNTSLYSPYCVSPNKFATIGPVTGYVTNNAIPKNKIHFVVFPQAG